MCHLPESPSHAPPAKTQAQIARSSRTGAPVSTLLKKGLLAFTVKHRQVGECGLVELGRHVDECGLAGLGRHVNECGLAGLGRHVDECGLVELGRHVDEWGSAGLWASAGSQGSAGTLATAGSQGSAGTLASADSWSSAGTLATAGSQRWAGTLTGVDSSSSFSSYCTVVPSFRGLVDLHATGQHVSHVIEFLWSPSLQYRTTQIKMMCCSYSDTRTDFPCDPACCASKFHVGNAWRTGGVHSHAQQRGSVDAPTSPAQRRGRKQSRGRSTAY